ncbi:flavin-containing monooxygenase [Mycolicibacterium psychrotolerans]|uniref:flavin-containing monooxygenase n=1 Tax=Mycolicibacterium psychrotolerans TaxID=216929 RepID=UPI003D67966C
MTHSPIEDLDVLIIGAGISGIGAAYYLQRDHPGKSYAILEARGAIGGTWDLFRYPGIRSDSDLHTFGYEFKPWRDEAIAGADKILAYLREAAAENGIDDHLRYHHKVLGASWSSTTARWTVDVERGDGGGELVQFSAKWVFGATGYYRYDEGFTPEFEGRERFGGQIIHPQHWPEDLDYTGKKVVVIGSGATAVTLLPAMAETAGHITMLQRSPTYILPLANKDPISDVLVSALGEKRGFAATRRKNIAQQRFIWRMCQRFPNAARRIIRRLNAAQLPADYPVDVHFKPSYNPWDQRLCLVPDGDLFRAISSGKASVVTDRVATFTETGIALQSGEHLDADIIITATGLNLLAFGGIPFIVDGKPVDISSTVAFKGMMLTDVPNFAYAIGYTNSSWTLKVGLLCEHFCRLLSHMDVHGYDICYPHLENSDMPTRPLLDFSAGYVQRSLSQLPRQGDGAPWLTSMDYHADVKLLRNDSVIDCNLRFANTTATSEALADAAYASESRPEG